MFVLSTLNQSCFQKIPYLLTLLLPFWFCFLILVINFCFSFLFYFWFDFAILFWFLSDFEFWFLICFCVWILNLVLYFSSDTFITLVSFNTWDHLFHFGLFVHFERKKKVSVTQEINLSPLPSESLIHRVLREVLPLLAVKSHLMIFYPEWVFIHLLLISSLNEFPRE